MEKKEKIFHTSYRTAYSHYKNVHTLPISTILNNHQARKYNKALWDLCVCVQMWLIRFAKNVSEM